MSSPAVYAKQGFTLIELIVVIGIISVLAASSAPFFSRFVTQNNHELMVDKVIGTIRKAQENSINGKNNTAWGICISGSVLRLYAGTCASPTISEDFDIPGTITITGLSDTTFSKRRGEPSGILTISIESYIKTDTITLNPAGGLTIN